MKGKIVEYDSHIVTIIRDLQWEEVNNNISYTRYKRYYIIPEEGIKYADEELAFLLEDETASMLDIQMMREEGYCLEAGLTPRHTVDWDRERGLYLYTIIYPYDD